MLFSICLMIVLLLGGRLRRTRWIVNMVGLCGFGFEVMVLDVLTTVLR
jgi:hypothetical protein